MKNKGFTLVELSIVIVIIGLLIGGVLIAQSMINTTKVLRLVNNLSQYAIAINNFKANYKNYPGDSPQFTPPGDGDGFYNGPSCAPAPNSSLYGGEFYQAWSHLSQAGLIDQKYVPWSPAGTCVGGIHPAYDDSSLAGVVWPFTQLDKNLNGKMKVPIYIYAPSIESMKYVILAATVDTFNVKVMEAKGLTNSYSPGVCAPYGGGPPVSCSASNALPTQMYYDVKP